MPDISNVEQALTDAVASACYPTGVPAGPLPVSSVIGAPVRVRRGWPDANKLDADLVAGIVNVSIFPMPGMSRLTTRYPRQWQVAVPAASSITATVAGNVITFGGNPGLKQLAGIRVLGSPYVVLVAPNEGPDAVAAALASAIPGASVSGRAVTVPMSFDIEARVVGFGALSKELRRQEQHIRVILWCPTPALRDAAGSAIDAVLAATDFLCLPGPAPTSGRLTYLGTIEDDVPSKANLWRRDLRYSVEYPTIQVMTAPSMIWGIRSNPDDGSTTVF